MVVSGVCAVGGVWAVGGRAAGGGGGGLDFSGERVFGLLGGGGGGFFACEAGEEGGFGGRLAGACHFWSLFFKGLVVGGIGR